MPLSGPASIELCKRILSDNRKDSDAAFIELHKSMQYDIEAFISTLYCRGLERSDILQECLVALRYKAVPLFDPTKKAKDGTLCSFGGFAMFVIRRHVWTLLKHSDRTIRRTMNHGVQMQTLVEQLEGVHEGELFADPRTFDPLTKMATEEEEAAICKALFSRLSPLEKEVARCYMNRNNYEEITELLNRNPKGKRVTFKSVDNALCRIRQKAANVLKEMGIEARNTTYARASGFTQE